MKNLCILGSTGSIGRSVLDVVDAYPSKFRPIILTAYKNAELLLEQARRFRPSLCVLVDEATAKKFAKKFASVGVKLAMGERMLSKVVSLEEVEAVVCAIDGVSGFESMLNAVQSGKEIMFANKEAFVAGSSVILPLAQKSGARIIPLDSEHSAVYQCLRAGSSNEVEKIILTASGGPFWRKRLDEIKAVTMDEVLAHPTWKMGRMVTVNSATLFNKALEVLEASALFSIPVDKIEVVIHPQSYVHALVVFRDRSVIAQLSKPDMRIPIQYALSHPERLDGLAEPLNIADVGKLEFYPVDTKRFPALQLAYEAQKGKWWEKAALCAINEALVRRFLNMEISFWQLHSLLEPVFAQRHQVLRSAYDEQEPEPSPQNVCNVIRLFSSYASSYPVSSHLD